MFLLADVKNKAVRSVPFRLQYVARASDSDEAYDVKDSFGYPLIRRFTAGKSISANFICSQKSSSILAIDLLAFEATGLKVSDDAKSFIVLLHFIWRMSPEVELITFKP